MMAKRIRNQDRDPDQLARHDHKIRQALVMQRLAGGCIITGGPFTEELTHLGRQRPIRIF